MTNTLRIIALAITIALSYPGPSAEPLLHTEDASPQADEPQQSAQEPVLATKSLSIDALDAEDQQLVEFARSQFAQIGIELPEVRIEFPDDEAVCFGHGGIYLPSKHEVRICRPSKATMIHELAHSWVETTLTNTQRTAFLQLRGLDTWTGGSDWDERGAEHAAEVITWAAMDENISVPWLDTNPDGTSERSWRLFKIDESDHDQLTTAFQLLTGETSPLRIADEPQDLDSSQEITSPEGLR
jgi:hypothetical protein